MEVRICNKCQKEKPIKSFKKHLGYRRKTCRACDNGKRQIRNPEACNKAKRGQRQRNPASAILIDCRKSDKKKNRIGNDIDLEFVSRLISNGCSYCGNSSIRITLDRIDNTKAHTKENVVPACIRCNYIRNSMPHEAWMNLVPSIKKTYDLGLFGDWKTKPPNVKKNYAPLT